MSQEGVPQTAVSCAWETSLIMYWGPNCQLNPQFERGEEKNKEKPRSRQRISAHPSQICGTWSTNGWRQSWRQISTTLNWISGLSCIAAMPGLLHPCKDLCAAFGEEKPKLPREMPRTAETPHTAPKSAAEGTTSTSKTLNSEESLLYFVFM